MRKIIAVISMMFLALAALQPCVAGEPIIVGSFNIRYDNTEDGVNAWPYRKEMVAESIQVQRVDVIGMQEALRHQVDDLAAFMPDYDWYGVGRDDGKDAGEFNPIFYLRDKLEMLEHATFWLSETPAVVGSLGWDATLPRVVTWAKFRNKADGTEFYFFNTHVHWGKASVKSAALIADSVAAIAQGHPFFLTGDFNFNEKSDSYKTITLIREGVPKIVNTYHASGVQHFGVRHTDPSKAGRIIDYVFSGENTRVFRHGFIGKDEGETHLSDHDMVVIEAALDAPGSQSASPAHTDIVYRPVILPRQRTFVGTTTITLRNLIGTLAIRYTLDGSEPGNNSPEYAGPFVINGSTQVKARAFATSGKSSGVAEARMIKATPRKAENPAASQPGLAYSYYEGTWKKIPDFAGEKLLRQGVSSGLGVSALKQREDGFAIVFSGYIEVPSDDLYTFYLESDDGSRLTIGDQLVVDNDGSHAAMERSGLVALEKGKHRMTISYFDDSEGEKLVMCYKGANGVRTVVPASSFSH